MKVFHTSLLLLFFSVLTFGQPQKDATVSDSYQSGLAKIKAIMLDDQEGIPADYENNPDDYAQTKNLDQDLNIDEMVKFFGCATSMCETYLKQALQHPFGEHGKARMLQRQRIIRLLVENPELKAQVDELVGRAKKMESLHDKLFSLRYRKKVKYTDNVDIPFLTQLLPKAVRKNYIDPYIKDRENTRTFVAGVSFLIIGTVCGSAIYSVMQSLNHFRAAKKEEDKKLTLSYGLNFLYGVTGLILYGHNIGEVYYESYTASTEKQSLIHGLHALASIAEQLESLCRRHDLSMQYSMDALQKSEESKKIMHGIKHSRYRDQYAYVFKFPAVHAFLHKIYKREKHLGKLFAYIGEIDALNAIATKIIEHKNRGNSFCFAEIIESEKPLIEAKDFWNLQVEDPVVNSIVMEKNIVLTGPNAGGKSTAVRALLQNIIFAQCAGFAAGKEFKTTFFDIIHSYLNISDGLKNGLSRFESEVEKAAEVKKIAQSLEVIDKKFLCMFDELFGGTAERDGERCAYEYAIKLFQSRRMLSLYATHFDKLKELERDKDSNCVNYKINPPVENEKGHLKYPYTLSPGASTQNIGYEIAKKAGIFE